MNMHRDALIAASSDRRACDAGGDAQPQSGFVTGHDFSRAARGAFLRRALAPAQLHMFASLIMPILFAPLVRAERCHDSGEKFGYWSKLATVVCEDARNQMHLKMASPDGKRLLVVAGKDLDGTFFMESESGSARRSLSLALVGSEVLWSPDSKKIALSMCVGGSGPCSISIFSDDESPPAVEVWDWSTAVVDAFSANHNDDYCYRDANLGALQWEDSSDRIVLIAEVPPSPHCEGHNEGYFEAFEVSLSERKTVSRWNMQQTVRRWRSLFGTGLRNDMKLVREDASLAARK